jgi:prepilin-type N-terminal cleavage/methylation domain-containing protein
MLPKRSLAKRPDAGFSMVEILIVLVTLSIVLAAAQPSLAGFTQRNQTRRALDRLVADLSAARLQAVRDGRRMALSVGSDGSYTIDTLSTGGSWAPVRTVSLGNEFPGLTLTPVNRRFEFNSRGLLVGGAENAVIAARRGTSADSMFVSPAGRVYRDF